LSEDEVSRIERVSRPMVPYPYWHQISWDADRLSPAERSILGPYLP
jgi:hypothetical protein